MRFRHALLASSVLLSSCLPLTNVAGLLPGGLAGIAASALPQPSASASPATPVASPLPGASASPSPSTSASPMASASPMPAGPTPAEIATVSGLKVSSCADEGTIRSATGPATKVRFTNSGDGRITVYWLDSQGKRVSYRSLTKGQSYEQPTYVTHPWLITNEQGQCLGIYTPEAAGTASVEILKTTAAPLAPVGPLDPVTEATITEARARAGIACLRAKGDTLTANAVQALLDMYLKMTPVLGEAVARQAYLTPLAKALTDKGC